LARQCGAMGEPTSRQTTFQATRSHVIFVAPTRFLHRPKNGHSRTGLSSFAV
jgi:hypothetical protein